MGDLGVMLSGAALVVLITVVLFELRCWRIRSATGRFGRRLEEIAGFVEGANDRHSAQLRNLERRLELAERAVGRAEDMAYRSVSGMRALRDDVGPRLLAAERAVGVDDVVVDLDARRNGKRHGNGNGRATGVEVDVTDGSAAGNGNGRSEGDGGPPADREQEREPQPAGQTGSS